MIVGVMSDPGFRIRPASRDDFATIERIAAANDEPTTAPRWPGYLYLDHLLAEAALLVAERGGAVVGYAGAAVVGGRHPAAHVTDLFVDPAVHGQGVGKHLLRGLQLEVDAPAWTTSSSADPRALTLYVRAGMQPLWPVLYLDLPLGLPAPDIRGDAWPGGRPSSRQLDPGSASAIELAWSGRDFAVQYRHWASRPGGLAFAVEVDGRPVAVGAVRDGRIGPGRVLDHLAIAPDTDPVAALVAALWSTAVRISPPEPAPEARLTFALPGPHPAVAFVLRNGCRITDHDTFCASDPDLVDPARTVPDPSFG
ncbi:MAG: GNAT family N-acetyltransferase [Chloroflexota bacterium]|nr:MAG: GNAT family N-acetyltransferase [Chloroflexota bacterium]